MTKTLGLFIGGVNDGVLSEDIDVGELKVKVSVKRGLKIAQTMDEPLEAQTEDTTYNIYRFEVGDPVNMFAICTAEDVTIAEAIGEMMVAYALQGDSVSEEVPSDVLLNSDIPYDVSSY